MNQNFKSLLMSMRPKQARTIAIANAIDANALQSVLIAKQMGFATAILCGPKTKIQKIAQENNISKSYLVHEFKRYTGKTVVEYINDLRCLNAQSLIKNGISVSTAGLSSGFDNLSYFSRTYKKYMSSLPSKEKH